MSGAEEVMRVDSRWSISKSVSIPNLVGFTIVLAGFIWQASALNSRLEAVERRQDRQEQSDAKTDASARLGLLEQRAATQDERLNDLKSDIREILNILNAIRERLPAKP
jgi:predicted  nucleic acid-binding Zn-ribbon protein